MTSKATPFPTEANRPSSAMPHVHVPASAPPFPSREHRRVDPDLLHAAAIIAQGLLRQGVHTDPDHVHRKLLSLLPAVYAATLQVQEDLSHTNPATAAAVDLS